MPRTQGMGAPCLGWRQHKLPEAGQTDLFCAGGGIHALTLCVPGRSCLPIVGKGAAPGMMPLSLCQSHETVEIPSILCLPVNGI